MKHNGPHWRAPVVMLLSLLIGTALAIGHHAFYASLAGTAVSSDPIKVVGWTTTQQQINIAVGTAFAFVVKASLILACSTAYMQLLFGAINRKSFRLEVLDNWFGGLNDFWSFLCMGTYWRYPLLTLAALTCWLLPIAAIISPAALSVVFDQVHPSPTQDAFVRLPAFDSLALAKYTGNNVAGTTELAYQGPREEVLRIAFASAAQGELLPIESPGTNATWQTTVTAPRLVCGDIEPDVQEAIKENLIAYFNYMTNSSDWSHWTIFMVNYMAWYSYSDEDSPMPFDKDPSEGWLLRDWTRGGRHPYESGIGMDMFFAILPRATWSLPLQNHGFELNVSDINTDPKTMVADKKALMDWYWEDSAMLRCRVVPTDYTLNFTYSGIDQTQAIRVLDMKDATEINYNHTTVFANGPDYNFVKQDPTTATALVGGAVAATRSSAAATVDAGAPVAATRSSAAPSSLSTATVPSLAARSTSSDIPLRLKGITETDIDASNITTFAQHSLRLASWAAIQEAAMTILLGAANSYGGPPGYAFIPHLYGGGDGISSTTQYRTEVFATVLLNSWELAKLGTVDPTANNITAATSGLAYDQAASLLPGTSARTRKPFKDALEELYLNITLSMASSNELTYNSTSPLAPAKVKVTQNLYGNVYSYAMDKLWLAYGVAIGVCVLNVVVGFIAVFRTEASFTDNFSTIVRTAHNAAIEVDLRETHLPGKDPLPRHVARAELRLSKADALLSEIKHLGSVTAYEGRRSSDFVR